MYNVVVVVAKRRENKEEEKTYYHCAVPSIQNHRASLFTLLLFLFDAKEHVALETFADGFPIIRRAPLIVDEKFHLVRSRR
jgi:hypothetical protein